MRIYKNEKLCNFDFFGGAKDFAKKLTQREFGIIEELFEDWYPEGMSAMEINNYFWFDCETIAEWLNTTKKEIFDRA